MQRPSLSAWFGGVIVAALLATAPPAAHAQVAPDVLPGDPGGQTDNPIHVSPKPSQVPSTPPVHQGPGVAPDTGVAATPGGEPTSRLVVGVHVGFGRTFVSTNRRNLAAPINATGWGPWFDAEAGMRVNTHVAFLGFAGFAFDSASNYSDRFQHLAIGARAVYFAAPAFWVSGGLAYVRERDSFDMVTATGVHTAVVARQSSPGIELRAGLDVWRASHVRFQVLFEGLAFQRQSEGYPSTIAQLAVGAQWR